MVIIFLLNLATLIFYYLFLKQFQGFPYVDYFPPLILLVSLFYSVFIWMIDPGIATLTPEYLPEPIEPRQALKRFCRKCHIIRLPGVNHCSFCEVCIKDYDHHCGIVGKCSGVNSHDHISIWGAIIGIYWASMAVCACGVGFLILFQYVGDKYLPKNKN